MSSFEFAKEYTKPIDDLFFPIGAPDELAGTQSEID